jgi:hypothetical protein
VWHGNSLRAGAAGSMAAGVQPRAVAGPPCYCSIRPGRAARLTRSGGKPLPARADWRPAGAASAPGLGSGERSPAPSRWCRETGLLKVLGFVRHQVAAVVCWQATTIAVIGVIVGVPLGLALGQFVWRAFATDFGVVPVVAVPSLVIAALAAAVLVAANALAAGPALLAA